MEILVRRLGSDMNDEYHKENIVVVQVVMPNNHLKQKQDQQNHKKELKWSDHTDANKKDQVYYDCNSNDDTFHDATQVEDVIKDTYYDDNNVHGKPINSNSDDGNENDDDTFHDAIQAEDVIDDTNDDNNNDRKPINNEFLQPLGQHEGAIRMMYEHEAIL